MKEQLLQDFARRAAEERPQAVALAIGEERMTYAELVRLAGRLGTRLLEAGVEPGDRVGLLAPKGTMAIVAMHAVLECGAIYVPLDLDSPAPRLARIVESAEPRLLLADSAATSRLDQLAALAPLAPVWSLRAEAIAGKRVRGELARAEWDVEARPPGVRVRSEDPSHLIFTSGSTGQPKGVVITHRGVGAAVAWGLRQFGTEPGDRVSCHAPLHFDQSTADVYATLAAGAELHLVPPSLNLNPRSLAALIRERELTQWCSVPSVLTYLVKFDAVAEHDFPALKRVLWGGEALPTPVLVHLMRRLPHVSFTNLYGPTETTITSSSYTVPGLPGDEREAIPIGAACDGEELIVLDPEMRPVEPGESGEIHIAGVGVSPGYWRDEERTRAAFVPDPRAPESGERVYGTGDFARIGPDGLVYFLGRADSQIKSRGYRIELGEVESALGTVAGIRECAVVGIEVGGFEGTTIAAAYVAADELDPVALRAALGSLLPPYMVPARWLPLEALPKNANGKVDRPRLREQFELQRAERSKAAR
jgi:amino acid adenylation domain-containing protein